MSTLKTEKAVRAWHKDGMICVELRSGRKLEFPVSHNSRLSGASHRELNHIEISPFGLHWPQLDEDLSIVGLMAGRFGNLHGGSRPGAGRKPVNHVRMQLSVKPETRDKIREFATKNAFSLSEAVEKMFDTGVVKAVQGKGTTRHVYFGTKSTGPLILRKATGIRAIPKRTKLVKEKVTV